jgi:uncharacterized membrane protein YcaP (DUF421 family)
MFFDWILGSWRTAGYVALSALLIYASVVVALRLGERRTMAQMTAFDFAVAVSLGAIIGRTATARSPSYLQSLVAVVVLLVLHNLLSWLRVHSAAARRLVDHRPIVLVRDGCVDRAALRGARLTPDDLRTALRAEGVSSFADVTLAVLEGRGTVSVLKSAEHVDAELLPPTS